MRVLGGIPSTPGAPIANVRPRSEAGLVTPIKAVGISAQNGANDVCSPRLWVARPRSVSITQ